MKQIKLDKQEVFVEKPMAKQSVRNHLGVRMHGVDVWNREGELF